MFTKVKTTRFIQVFLLAFIAIFVTFIMSLSAYAMSPTQEDLNQATSINQAASTQSDAQNNTDTQTNTSDINSSKDDTTEQAAASDNSDVSAQVTSISDEEASLQDSPKLSSAPSLEIESAQDKIQDTQVLPEKNQEIINADYPQSYDLRNVDGKNYVTPVKLQNPWNSCWAFAIIAASETSIASMYGLSTDQNNIDLSEHHMTWFAKNHIPKIGEKGYTEGNTQAGEGRYYIGTNPSDSMDWGTSTLGSSTLGAGIGPVLEDYCPYRGVIGKVTAKLNGVNTDFNSYQEAIDAGATPSYYSKNDDWTVDESKRFAQVLKLEESFILPSVIPKEDGSKNDEGIAAYKSELMQGRGISVGYAADTTEASEKWSNGRYINTQNWAQYTWDKTAAKNHCVEIVGWDDNVSADKFTITDPCKFDSSGHQIYKLASALAGTQLATTEAGEPYYVLGENKIIIKEEHREKLLDKTTSSEGKITYTWKTDFGQGNVDFANDGGGLPCIPGTTDYVHTNYPGIIEYSRDTGASYKPKGNGAWIVKNSWGAKNQNFPNNGEWGINGNGYFYISYYDYSLSNAETFNFGETDYQQPFDYTLAYEYDLMPVVYSTGASIPKTNYGSFSMGNKFCADNDCIINGVSGYTVVPGVDAKFDVYLLNDDAKDALDGQLVASKSVTYKYAGYHRVKLDSDISIPKGKCFSVVCTQNFVDSKTGTNASLPLCIGFNEKCVEKFGKTDYSVAVVNDDESFVAYNKTSNGQQTIIDWKQFMETQEFKDITKSAIGEDDRPYLAIDNVPVKAYGHNTVTPAPEDNSTEVNAVSSAATGDGSSVAALLSLMVVVLSLVLLNVTSRYVTGRRAR